MHTSMSRTKKDISEAGEDIRQHRVHTTREAKDILGFNEVCPAMDISDPWVPVVKVD